MPGRILILLHETDPFPRGYSYFIWGLRDAWLEMGLDVRVAKGLGALEPADLVIPHVDLTVTPPAYREALETMPNVVNRGVYDISKRRVSENLLGPGDAHDGPVIVKTDLNYSGWPELMVAPGRMTPIGRISSSVRTGLERLISLTRGGGMARETGYRIFDSIEDVPKRVFLDPDLVVERFLPEQEGETFFLRWYIFIGDRYRSMRVGSPNRIVKMHGLTSSELGLPVPPEVVALREQWNLDFGRIDYVVHRGKPVILDVNRTPADRPAPARLALCRPYAPGIVPLLDRTCGLAEPRTYIDVDASS